MQQVCVVGHLSVFMYDVILRMCNITLRGIDSCASRTVSNLNCLLKIFLVVPLGRNLLTEKQQGILFTDSHIQ